LILLRVVVDPDTERSLGHGTPLVVRQYGAVSEDRDVTVRWPGGDRALSGRTIAEDGDGSGVVGSVDVRLGARWWRRRAVLDDDVVVPRAQPRVVSVLSPKGGTGKTTVSTNLAVGLARRYPDQVALVDLDVAFGDVAAALLLDPRHGVRGAAAAGEIDGVLVTHPSGLRVLGAPDVVVPDTSSLAGPTRTALDALAEAYPVVIADTGAGLDPVTMAAVERSTDLVLVAVMDVPTLLGLRKALRWLDDLGHVDARRHLVLNRGTAGDGLSLEDVEATVGLPVSVVIPSDAAVTQSVNAGRTLAATGAGEVAAAIDRLVDLFA
jgi:pilus assembly protein CpaE